LTAAELEAHPEFPYITWDLKPRIKAKLPVAAIRGGPINISYEVHGDGPRKLVVSECVVIMSFVSTSVISALSDTVDFGPYIFY
jgi:hypothetical protein